jgi:hypothetical protein
LREHDFSFEPTRRRRRRFDDDEPRTHPRRPFDLTALDERGG